MTSPQQSPGDQRENTALEVGAAVTAIMTAASLMLTALLGPAVAKVLRGAAPRTVARQLHAAAVAAVQRAVAQATQVLDEAEQRVTTEATGTLAELVPRLIPRRQVMLPNPVPSRSWTAVRDQIQAAGLNALRETDDQFRRAAQAATAGGSSGTQAAQKMLDQLAAQGVTVFTDRRGRDWDLSAYCEMAVRTAATRLALATQLGLMGPAGMDLVVVDAPSGELGCRKCAPWEGRVLSLSGRAVTGQLVSVVDAVGARKSTNVAGSLAEAVSAGLLHPNCRHALLPFVDGAGSLPLVGGPRGFVRHGHPIYRVVIPQVDAESYKAQQKQRALERVVRRQQAVRTVALTPLAKAQANRRLAAARSNLELHVKTYHLTRQRYREHAGKAR